MHEGIGGTSALISIEGIAVFVKKIRLTDTEKQPENIMSTANLYGLQPYCQYGMPDPIGSPGFGVGCQKPPTFGYKHFPGNGPAFYDNVTIATKI